STLRSSPAFLAPFSTAFQKTCVVPLGITAILGLGFSGWQARPAPKTARHNSEISPMRRFIWTSFGSSFADDALTVVLVGAIVDALDVLVCEIVHAAEGLGAELDAGGLGGHGGDVPDFARACSQRDEAVVLEVHGLGSGPVLGQVRTQRLAY